MLKRYMHLSGTELADLSSATVAVCPLGAVENHGPHLPCGTDSILADAILDAASEKLPEDVSAVRLPTIWLGASIEHSERAGTLSTPATRLISNIADIAEGLANSGMARLILFSAHGGNNPPAKIATIEARARHGMLCAAAHWLDFGTPKELVPPTPLGQDAHGGWLETSMMLAVAPNLVANLEPGDKVAGNAPPAPMLYPDGPISWGWMSGDLGNEGIIGTPRHATAELGHLLVDHAAASVAELISQIAAARWSP